MKSGMMMIVALAVGGNPAVGSASEKVRECHQGFSSPRSAPSPSTSSDEFQLSGEKISVPFIAIVAAFSAASTMLKLKKSKKHDKIAKDDPSYQVAGKCVVEVVR